MTMKAQTSTNHMGNQATGLFPVRLNQSFRKSMWIIQKDEGCFWTWKSSRRELSPPPPHEKSFFSLKHFQMGNNNRSQHFLSSHSAQAQSHVASSFPARSSVSPTEQSPLLSPFSEGQAWLTRGEVSCPPNTQVSSSQTESKDLIATHQLIAICRLVYEQFDSPVNPGYGNNFETRLYHQYMSKSLLIAPLGHCP